MSYAIEMNHITKTFGDVVANSDISFDVKTNEVHCLLGENGTGKTTLMNVLFGLHQADSGEVFINGKKSQIKNPKDAFKSGIGMVHQHFMLVEQLTVLQNIILGKEQGTFFIDYKKARKVVLDLVEKYNFKIDIDAKVSDLSVGIKQRVEIIKTLYRGADVIILDEPTAVLTPQEVSELFKILDSLKEDGKTIIFITHKLNETMEISDRVTVLRKGEKVITTETSKVSPEILAKHMVGRDVKTVVNDHIGENTGEVSLRVENLKLLEKSENGISFSIKAGEIFGIAGVEGNGQLELEEMLVGLRDVNPDSKISLLGNDLKELGIKERKDIGIGYIPSDRHKRAMVESFSIKENFLLGYQDLGQFSSSNFIKDAELKTVSENNINNFNIKLGTMNDAISSLSGGNQQKVILSREVNMNPDLIIAAQPVRGLDIGAIEFIHKTLIDLKNQGKAILLISAELSEVMNMSDRYAVLYEGEFKVVANKNDLTREQVGLLMAGESIEKIGGNS